MRDLVIGMFIVAARGCALWPHPERYLAQKALLSLPASCFDHGARLVHQEPWERPN